MIINSSSQAFFSLKPIQAEKQAARNEQAETSPKETSKSDSASNFQQNQTEEKQLSELRSRDKEVHAHEQAHQAAAGSLSKGGPSFEYALGPDGQQYVVGGEVQIDTFGVSGDPEATLQKAQQIQQAALALAPAQPSAQDSSVAVAAAAMAAEARAEIASQNTSENKNGINFENIAAKVKDTYTSVKDSDTQQLASLIDLTA